MAKTEVILLSHIVGLGAEADHVKVAAGYARNYLFPHRLAIPLNEGNKRRLEVLRQRRAEREAHELNTMTELSKSLSKMTLSITVKTCDDGKMHGAVTNGTIADELKTQFEVTLDKKKVHLEKPIKAIGEYDVEMRLHHDVTTTLKVIVVSSTPVAAPAAEAPPRDAAKEGAEGRPARGERPHRAERKPRATKEAPAADAKGK
ncbi:MAG: 50S ribosomal protein L9 [Verrucomicrobia bacterium]|nr:50S ribosomal protein L9 [Verrucomicrobiota bacterium]